MREERALGIGGLLAALAIGAALTLAYAWVVNGGALEAWPWPAYLFQFPLLVWGPFFVMGLRWHWG